MTTDYTDSSWSPSASMVSLSCSTVISYWMSLASSIKEFSSVSLLLLTESLASAPVGSVAADALFGLMSFFPRFGLFSFLDCLFSWVLGAVFDLPFSEPLKAFSLSNFEKLEFSVLDFFLFYLMSFDLSLSPSKFEFSCFILKFWTCTWAWWLFYCIAWTIFVDISFKGLASCNVSLAIS